MSIIFGLLSLIISILLPLLILFFTGFEVLHFSLFFIVPVGAGIIGYVCGFGYYKGLYKSNTYITGKHYLIGIILSIICIIGIKYTSYTITCISPETSDIIYSLDGDHISNYCVDGYGQLDFLTYTKYMIENTPISFSYKRRALGSVSNPKFCWILTIIDFLGVIIGGLIAGSSQKEHPYCHSCKLYKKKKDVFKLPKADGNKFFEELESITSNIETSESLNSLLTKYTMDKSLNNKEHYLCQLIYCENCRTALLNFELYEVNSKNKLDKNSDFNHTIDINYDCIRNFIEKSSTI